MAYWYNVKTGRVETDSNRGLAQDLLGPYDSEEEAKHGVETAHRRAEAADHEDSLRYE